MERQDKNFNFFTVTCSDINLPNGEVIYSISLENERYPVNTEATFSCSPEYILSGSSSSTCLASGNSAVWNPQIPTCNLGMRMLFCPQIAII